MLSDAGTNSSEPLCGIGHRQSCNGIRIGEVQFSDISFSRVDLQWSPRKAIKRSLASKNFAAVADSSAWATRPLFRRLRGLTEPDFELLRDMCKIDARSDTSNRLHPWGLTSHYFLTTSRPVPPPSRPFIVPVGAVGAISQWPMTPCS